MSYYSTHELFNKRNFCVNEGSKSAEILLLVPSETGLSCIPNLSTCPFISSLKFERKWPRGDIEDFRNFKPGQGCTLNSKDCTLGRTTNANVYSRVTDYIKQFPLPQKPSHMPWTEREDFHLAGFSSQVLQSAVDRGNSVEKLYSFEPAPFQIHQAFLSEYKHLEQEDVNQYDHIESSHFFHSGVVAGAQTSNVHLKEASTFSPPTTFHCETLMQKEVATMAPYNKHNNHIQGRSSRRKYQCSSCEKCFDSRTGFKIHLRKKHLLKTFKCSAPDCSKAFSNESSVREHEVTHGMRVWSSTEEEKDFSAKIFTSGYYCGALS